MKAKNYSEASAALLLAFMPHCAQPGSPVPIVKRRREEPPAERTLRTPGVGPAELAVRGAVGSETGGGRPLPFGRRNVADDGRGLQCKK